MRRSLLEHGLDDVSPGTVIPVDVLEVAVLGSAMTGRIPESSDFSRPPLVAVDASPNEQAMATIATELRIATRCRGAASRAELGREHLR